MKKIYDKKSQKNFKSRHNQNLNLDLQSDNFIVGQ
jgi:hypothetical protein